MSKVVIVANFKSNQTLNEANTWIEEFKKAKDYWQGLQEKEVIICPSYSLLLSFHSAFVDTNIKIGAQDSSPFGEGAFTGEINAKQIKDFANYVLIGHSERRKYFNENQEMLIKKIDQARENGLEAIFLVSDDMEQIPQGVKIVAYEPIFAIGSGTPDTPSNADQMASNLKQQGNFSVLYGGSVNSQNVKSFTKCQNLDGVLVGGASLDPQEFLKIIENA